jgi:serine/threonine-protein kinase
MAEVWLAESLGAGGFSKRVALKTMLRHVADTPQFVNMFIEEASVAAQLAHENIVQVFDFGELEGHYFLAMECVYGRTLRQISKRYRKLAQPFSVPFLARVAIDVCGALQYMHDFAGPEGKVVGLVHRDVSPENVLVSFTGTTKLVDFGVAAAAGRVAPPSPGVLVGKWRYMAPERIKGAPGIPQSDLFSMGVILYELATGWPPFQGETEAALLLNILDGVQRPPRQIVPSLPEKFEAIILRALARDPLDRHATAAELADDLRAFLTDNDRDWLHRGLDLHMGQLFSDASELPGYVRRASARAAESANDAPLDIAIEEVPADAMRSATSTRPSESGSSEVGRVETAPPVSGAQLRRPSQIFPEDERPAASSRSPDLFASRDVAPPSSGDVFTVLERPGEARVSSFFGTDAPARAEELELNFGPEGPIGDTWETPHEGAFLRSLRATADTATAVEREAASAFDRGLQLVFSRRYGDALKWLREAAEKAPSNRNYRWNLKRLEQLLERQDR